MNRRKFVHQSGLAVLSTPLWMQAAGTNLASAQTKSMDALGKASLDRIGVTTVSLRAQFPSTQRQEGNVSGYSELTLETAPEFIASELGLHNVEVWQYHLEDRSIAYCEKVRAAAEKAGSRIVNIQASVTNPSDPDAEVRAKGVAEACEWIDRAVAMGSPRVRIDTGGGDTPFDVKTTGDSFRRMMEYGQEKGVTILVENHGGYSNVIDNVVAILAEVDHPMCRALADYGNTSKETTKDVIAELAKLFPYLGFVSAKGLTFDEHYQHTAYDFGAVVRATEESGYQGIYSVELYPAPGGSPPADAVRAVNMLKDIILEVVE
jgi:sugar phosphate isomerase/epimerase